METVARLLLTFALYVVQDVLGYLTGKAILSVLPARAIVPDRFERLADAPFRAWRCEGATYVVPGWATILIGHAFWVLVAVAAVAVVRSG